jgi:hypothetical protein
MKTVDSFLDDAAKREIQGHHALGRSATWFEEEHAGTLNTFIMFFSDVMTPTKRSRGLLRLRAATLREAIVVQCEKADRGKKD